MPSGDWSGRGLVAPDRADEAIEDLMDLRVSRYPQAALLPRIWQLRDNLSSYDAAYIALTEALGARLSRLASASGHTAPMDLI